MHAYCGECHNIRNKDRMAGSAAENLCRSLVSSALCAGLNIVSPASAKKGLPCTRCRINLSFVSHVRILFCTVPASSGIPPNPFFFEPAQPLSGHCARLGFYTCMQVRTAMPDSFSLTSAAADRSAGSALRSASAVFLLYPAMPARCLGHRLMIDQSPDHPAMCDSAAYNQYRNNNLCHINFSLIIFYIVYNLIVYNINRLSRPFTSSVNFPRILRICILRV